MSYIENESYLVSNISRMQESQDFSMDRGSPESPIEVSLYPRGSHRAKQPNNLRTLSIGLSIEVSMMTKADILHLCDKYQFLSTITSMPWDQRIG